MGNQKVKQFAEDVVKDEIRKGNLIKSRDVLAKLPELVDSVHINKAKMRSSIERCLSSKNPLNSLLNIFGVQLVKKEKTINSLLNFGVDYSDVAVKIDDSYAKHWLTLNEKKFRAVVEEIAQKLHDLETQADKSYDDQKNRGDKLFDKYEKLKGEYEQLKNDAETSEKFTAQRIQYILSLGGREASCENEQLIELLKDMDISVFWDCNDVPMTDAEMFTEILVDDESMIGIKPCLVKVKDGEVYLKGIRQSCKK